MASTLGCPAAGINAAGNKKSGADDRTITVGAVLSKILRDPFHSLILRWNWKSALLSSLVRALIFFLVNLQAGWHAAVGAMLAELALRSMTSGFYGAVTEAFSKAQPAWKAMAVTMAILPLLNHSLEFVVHWLRGTPNLAASIAASMVFTSLSTAFNLHAMRHGVLTVGDGSKALHHDFARLPALLFSFLSSGPLWLLDQVRRGISRGD
jgi:hypothetical protein